MNNITSLLRTLLFIFSAACFSHQANADTKFKVGMTLPLSGGVSDYGVSIQNSVSLGINENPEKFSACTMLRG
jgi:hypothetical protein